MDSLKQSDTSLEDSSSLNRGLTVFELKMIAIITMFIDHVGAIIVPYLQSCTTQPGVIVLLEGIMTGMRLIGRLSFPIFAFLIVNGFYHTHSRKKYVLRLGVFAFISEPFFDLATSSSLLNWGHQNVFFTLCLGLMTIWGYDRLTKCQKSQLLGGGLVLCFGLVAFYLRADYDSYGVFMIFLMYLFFYDRKKMNGMIIFLNVLLYGPHLFSFPFDASFIEVYYGLTLTSGCVFVLQASIYLQYIAQLFSLLALWPISLYTGEKGSPRFHRYFFYWFYPVHLLFLSGVVYLFKALG